MTLMYNSKHKIKFTDISEKYKVDRSLKGKISELHACVITYVANNFENTKKYKQRVVDILNIITYIICSGDVFPFDWMASDPFTNVPDVDEDTVASTLGEILLTVEGVEWDVKPTQQSDYQVSESIQNLTPETEQSETDSSIMKSHTIHEAKQIVMNNIKNSNVIKQPAVTSETAKQDLYIQSPRFPQFDYTKPWIQEQDGPDLLTIYTTLPEIPTKQCEISATTDVTKMTRDEKMRLYPSNFIRTRASVMYESCPGIDMHPELGLIIPISGFSKDQIIDNIVRYPHIYKLTRMIDNDIFSFYSHIEIDGELKGTLDVWDILPESKIIPRQTEFVKEYVVRRYLLERDVKHVEHNYKLFGDLSPFLTLFMPADDYIRYGYTNVEEIATQCVVSRVKYKQSRNPILRRLGEA